MAKVEKVLFQKLFPTEKYDSKQFSGVYGNKRQRVRVMLVPPCGCWETLGTLIISS
jgi:hypothetical protein